MRVVIAGAGIGGLTAALALGQAGIDVRVFEASRRMEPLGVGINILPHAVKGLDSLGLLETLTAAAIPTEELVYFDPSGRPVWTELRGRAAGYRWPQLSIHRGALQIILYDAVREALGPESVTLGRQLNGFHEAADGRVVARFTDRHRNQEQEEVCECLIGADGIHSTVRSQLYPDEGEPQWNGILQCRGTTEAPPFLTGRSYVAVGTPEQLFVAYPIRPYPAVRRGALINWIAGIRIDKAQGFPPEEWNRRGDASRILPYFEGWEVPCFDIKEIISRASAIYEFPQVDREPIPSWTFGRVTLLGDAAHPMSPNGSNGASQAILDGLALRDALAQQSNVFAALKLYEWKRERATAQVVLANRQFGIQQVARILAKYEQTEPDPAAVDAEVAQLMTNYRRVAGFDVETVNAN